jgi:hypothetical protein
MKRTTKVIHSQRCDGLYLAYSPMRGPQEPTEFESEAKRLGLSPEERSGSQELRHWATRWYRTKYVPEDLLKVWCLPVEE